MDIVIPFRRYKFPHVLETQFFDQTSPANQDFAKEDLSRSGLSLDDIGGYASAKIKRPEKAQAAYVIPYWNVDGTPVTDGDGNLQMYRMRLKYPQYSKEQRYTQPSGEQLVQAGLPSFAPYIHPAIHRIGGSELVCCEGEKKTLSVIKNLGLPAFGIGGCELWRNPSGDGTVHPWISDLIARRACTSITIVPDGDVFRYDICRAYGTFARALESIGLQVSIVIPDGKIDDLLVEWGELGAERWSQLKRVSPNDLVQSSSSLVKRYGLAFKVDSKDRPIVYQHTSNVMRLMEESGAVPRIWRNLDTNRVMVGDHEAVPDYSEMRIANHFQHQFGLDKVTHKMVYSCIQALARQNERSPMLEWIKAQKWDGEKRIDTWLQRLWGVEDSPYVREVGSKWLVSACARLADPGVKVDWMLIIIGKQGVGKTSMPDILFRGNAETLYGEHNDKDLHLLMHSTLCVGFDELDSFGKRESSNLKAMITRCEDAFRPPYGASVESFKRRFVLYGCGNRYEFLQHDPSGYRRYAVVDVGGTKLKFADLEDEVGQLWAEAWERYGTGVRFYEVENASAEAEKYVVPNLLEEQIRGWIEKQRVVKHADTFKDGKLLFTMNQLAIGIGLDPTKTQGAGSRDIAAIIRGLGFEKSKTMRHCGVVANFWVECNSVTVV